MVVDLGWKEVQKTYIIDKGIRRKDKTKIQIFMTDSILKKVIRLDESRIHFIFELNEKEYDVTLIGNRSCEIGSSLFFEYGMKITREILPYLREYKIKYINTLAM